MGWQLTEDPEAFHRDASGLLAGDPGGHTVLLTVLDTLRRHGPHAYGAGTPWFGRWRDEPTAGDAGAGPSSAPRAAVALATPPYPVALGPMPPSAAVELAGALRESGRRTGGVRGGREAARAFADAWCGRDVSWRVDRDERRYRLDRLLPPQQPVPGQARVARAADRDLLVTWLAAFVAETQPGAARDVAGLVDQRLGAGLLSVWVADGAPVAMAGRSARLGGMVRIGPVYTPPEQRRRGYAAGLTHAVSAAAQATGASEVLLFTDLANPTSNGVYLRLGYRAVVDEVALTFQMR